MKYIFPLVRNVESEDGETGYPVRLEIVGETQGDAIHEAIRILGINPHDGGDAYRQIYRSFSLDLSRSVKPLLEDKK